MLKMFFSTQVKRSIIIITSKLAYKSCRVTERLKTEGSRKLVNISKILKAHRNRPPPPPSHPPPETQFPPAPAKIPPQSRNWTPPLVRHLTQKPRVGWNILRMIADYFKYVKLDGDVQILCFRTFFESIIQKSLVWPD